MKRVTALSMLVLGVWPAGAWAQNAVRPQLGTGGAVEVSLGRIIVSLVICLMVAVLAILLIRQRSGRGDLPALFARLQPQARSIAVVETRRLSPHADICLVRHEGRDYLLVLQQGSMTLLRETVTSPGIPSCD